MKIAIGQCKNNSGVQLMFMRAAAENKVDLLLFPELVQPLVMPKNLTIGVGKETKKRNKRYNSYFLIQNGKIFYEYRKQHMFPGYDDGRAPGKISNPFGNIYFATCYDIRFADVFNQMKNPELIIIPADFPLVRIKEWRKMLIARAMQMKCYVIGVNTPEGGNSMIVAPDGDIHGELDAGKELMLISEMGVT